MSGTAGCFGGISGSAAVNWVENYVRPLSCGILTLYNDYLTPAVEYYNLLDPENTFNTGGCSGALVHDGYSGDNMTRLKGEDVYYLHKTINSMYNTIGLYRAYLIKAAAYKNFSDGDIRIKTGTGGCDSCS